MDFICLCVRVLKSGSHNLRELLIPAFSGKKVFYLPDTLDLDGRISTFQRWRFRKTRLKNLLRHYGTASLDNAFGRINAQANEGDLIAGGHIDFPTAREKIGKKLKIITILRNPYSRARSEYRYMRANYYAEDVVTRLSTKLLRKMAGQYSFPGYLDFLAEHADVYGNIACTYVGWNGQENISQFFTRNVFHSGVLEENRKFARALSAKIGKEVHFPHENRSADTDQDFSGEERRKIEKLYAKDLELYEWQLRNSD